MTLTLNISRQKGSVDVCMGPQKDHSEINRKLLHGIQSQSKVMLQLYQLREFMHRQK